MTGSLDGLLVLDFSHVVAGPIATMMLADLGADVIKVEPAVGDRARGRGGVRTSEDGVDEVSGYLAAFNRGKRSVVLDLKSVEGKTAALELAARADVIVENFSPGTMERLGLGFDELRRRNPKLITVSVSLFGEHSTNPAVDGRVGLAITAEAESGISQVDPDRPPRTFGFPLGDHTAGMEAFASILLGLLERNATGQGKHVDISMVTALARFNASAIASHSLLGRYDIDLAPPIYGHFETTEGWVTIALSSDEQWARLAEVIGGDELREDERFRAYRGRNLHRQEAIDLVTAWAKEQSLEDVLKVLTAVKIPCGRVATPGTLIADDLALELGILEVIDDGVGGTVRVPAPLGSAASRARPSLPRLGQHTDEVLAELGLFAHAEAPTTAERAAAAVSAAPTEEKRGS